MKKRVKIIVSGRVQGAAYRDTVERIAYELGITGTVRNLADGTVEVICESNDKSVAQFLNRIDIQRWPIIVKDMRKIRQRPTRTFKEFQVIGRDESNRDILERLDLGMNYMADMNEKQDKTIAVITSVSGDVKTMDGHIKTMDGHIMTMDGHIKTMDGHIKTMDSNMSGHFGRLDRKYGEFGKTTKGVARDIKAIRKTTRAVAPRPKKGLRKTTNRHRMASRT